MQTQTIDAKITFLADKLGIERAELWNAIIKQARVEAWTDTGMAVLGLIAVIVAIYALPRVIKFGNDNGEYGCWPPLAIIECVLCVTGIIAGAIIFLVNGYSAAQIFPNPTYYAYTHLIY